LTRTKKKAYPAATFRRLKIFPKIEQKGDQSVGGTFISFGKIADIHKIGSQLSDPTLVNTDRSLLEQSI